MNQPIKIAIAGASGRMGRMLIEMIAQSAHCELVGACDIHTSPMIGNDACGFLGKASGVSVQSDVARAIESAEVLIDFTRPEATMHNLAVCVERRVKMVIGTTGFSEAQKIEIQRAAEHIGVVMAPNMSVGVNVTLRLLEVAAKALADGFDIEIFEAHHKHKVDAPSGTALKMGEVIAQALEQDLREKAVFTRHGHTGERVPGTIGFSTARGGDIVGDHTVMFAGIGERIEITHRASSRTTYAQGSIKAAQYLATQQTGLFDMFDVLGLRHLTP